VVSERTDMLPVKVNPSAAMLNQGAFKTGPDVVAGTVNLESDIRFRSHVVKVAGHSMDVNYPIRSARGRGGAYRGAATIRNLRADSFPSSVTCTLFYNLSRVSERLRRPLLCRNLCHPT